MKTLILAATLAAALLAPALATAATAACTSQRLSLEVSRIQRVQVCAAQGPNAAACLQQQQVEALQWQLVDALCPAPTPQCSVNRQIYNLTAQQRKLKCEQAGSYNDPVCRARQQQEDVNFLQVKLSCFND